MTATPTKPTLNVLLIADSDSQLLACKASAALRPR